MYGWILETWPLAGAAGALLFLFLTLRTGRRETAAGGGSSLTLMSTGDGREDQGGDSDMKIAPEYPSRREDEQPRQNEELNELFQEVVENRQNGNREKAVLLGKELAFDTADPRGRAMSGSTREESPVLSCHRKILFAFVVDQMIDRRAANPLVAEMISSSFYGELKQRYPALYQEIQRSGAFSLYLLCSRERSPQGYGEEFAQLIQRPEDSQAICMGNALYAEFVQYLEERMTQTDFIP